MTLEKIYKDWNEIDFKITFGPFGEEVQIIKPKKVPASVNESQPNRKSCSGGQDKHIEKRCPKRINRLYQSGNPSGLMFALHKCETILEVKISA
jgi:hypothetical protein